MKTVEISVQGMTCGGCTAAVQAALARVTGVDQVEVSLTPGRAVVRYDETRAGTAALIQAVKAAGYRVGGFAARDAVAG